MIYSSTNAFFSSTTFSYTLVGDFILSTLDGDSFLGDNSAFLGDFGISIFFGDFSTLDGDFNFSGFYSLTSS